MAYYNSVGTPRFYVNVVEWLMQNGIMDVGSVFRTLPVNPSDSNDISGVTTDLTFIQGMTDYAFVAVLGHTMSHTADNLSEEENFYTIEDNNGVAVSDMTNVVNTEIYATADCYPSYYGFSIATFTGQNNIQFRLGNVPPIGSVVIGTYYEMPHSADLNLTLEYQTGTKTIETRGGASLSNTMAQPPKWGDLAQWELSDPNNPTGGQELAHKSRRIWSLSFSFLSKEDTFPKYNALNRYTNANLSIDAGTEEDSLLSNYEETLLDSDNFFSQVWEKVGTASPFIFQPDKDTPEFAIAKFEKNISFQETAPSLYSVKCRIREVW